MNPIGDAASVEELARVYRSEAQHIERAYTDSLRHLQNTARNRWWEGNRANRTLHGHLGERRIVLGQANELRSMAQALDGHAGWIRETIRELEGLEQRVRAWAAQHPPNPETPGPDASWISYWPPYCSYEWRGIVRRLRSYGAHL